MPVPTLLTDNALPTATLERLNALAEQYVGSLCTALSLAVWHRDERVLDASWGWQGEMSAPLADPRLRFDLASVTKLFTTTAFLKLLSDSGLSLATPLVEIIPEFGATGPRPINGGWDPHTNTPLPVAPDLTDLRIDPAQITFQHLLTHTGGLVPWRALYELTGPVPPPPTELDPLDPATRFGRGLAAICETPFIGPPGAAIRYSDLGLILLGEAAVRLFQDAKDSRPGLGDSQNDPSLITNHAPLTTDHQPLATLIHSLVLQPAHLTTLTFNPVRDHGLTREQTAPTEIDPRWRHRRAWGEVHDENACGLGGVAGHAGLFGAAVDVAAFGQAWLSGGGAFGLAPELVAGATSVQAVTGIERRGLGWMLKSLEGSSAGNHFSPQSFGHTGFTGTSLWIDPEARLVVALLTNSVYPGRLQPGTIELRRAVHDAIWEGTAT